MSFVHPVAGSQHSAPGRGRSRVTVTGRLASHLGSRRPGPPSGIIAFFSLLSGFPYSAESQFPFRGLGPGRQVVENSIVAIHYSPRPTDPRGATSTGDTWYLLSQDALRGSDCFTRTNRIKLQLLVLSCRYGQICMQSKIVTGLSHKEILYLN